MDPFQGKLQVYEDIYDAMREDVRALGGTKIVGPIFWPEKSVKDAQQRLNDCLNRNREEKLDQEQFMLLIRRAREVGSYATMGFLGGDTGFKCDPVKQEDERAALQRQFMDSVVLQRQLVERMERLTQTPLQAITGGKS